MTRIGRSPALQAWWLILLTAVPASLMLTALTAPLFGTAPWRYPLTLVGWLAVLPGGILLWLAGWYRPVAVDFQAGLTPGQQVIVSLLSEYGGKAAVGKPVLLAELRGEPLPSPPVPSGSAAVDQRALTAAEVARYEQDDHEAAAYLADLPGGRTSVSVSPAWSASGTLSGRRSPGYTTVTRSSFAEACRPRCSRRSSAHRPATRSRAWPGSWPAWPAWVV